MGIVKAPPHNSAARLAMSFPPSAACKFLDLPPVNLRNLHLHLTKNPFASQPPHLRGVTYSIEFAGKGGKSCKAEGKNNVEFGIRNAEKSRTRKKYESATNSIARKGSRGDFVPSRLSLVGFGATPTCSAGDQHLKRTQQRRRQRSVPASNFAASADAPPSCSSPQDSVKNQGTTAQFVGSAGDAFSAICFLQKSRFTSSKPSISAIASDKKCIRHRTNSFVRYCPKKLPSRKQFFEKAGNSLVDSEHLCGQIPLACVGQDDDDVLAREFRTRRHLRCRPDRRA